MAAARPLGPYFTPLNPMANPMALPRGAPPQQLPGGLPPAQLGQSPVPLNYGYAAYPQNTGMPSTGVPGMPGLPATYPGYQLQPAALQPQPLTGAPPYVAYGYPSAPASAPAYGYQPSLPPHAAYAQAQAMQMQAQAQAQQAAIAHAQAVHAQQMQYQAAQAQAQHQAALMQDQLQAMQRSAGSQSGLHGLHAAAGPRKAASVQMPQQPSHALQTIKRSPSYGSVASGMPLSAGTAGQQAAQQPPALSKETGNATLMGALTLSAVASAAALSRGSPAAGSPPSASSDPHARPAAPSPTPPLRPSPPIVRTLDPAAQRTLEAAVASAASHRQQAQQAAARMSALPRPDLGSGGLGEAPVITVSLARDPAATPTSAPSEPMPLQAPNSPASDASVYPGRARSGTPAPPSLPPLAQALAAASTNPTLAPRAPSFDGLSPQPALATLEPDPSRTHSSGSLAPLGSSADLLFGNRSPSELLHLRSPSDPFKSGIPRAESSSTSSTTLCWSPHYPPYPAYRMPAHFGAVPMPMPMQGQGYGHPIPLVDDPAFRMLRGDPVLPVNRGPSAADSLAGRTWSSGSRPSGGLAAAEPNPAPTPGDRAGSGNLELLADIARDSTGATPSAPPSARSSLSPPPGHRHLPANSPLKTLQATGARTVDELLLTPEQEAAMPEDLRREYEASIGQLLSSEAPAAVGAARKPKGRPKSSHLLSPQVRHLKLLRRRKSNREAARRCRAKKKRAAMIAAGLLPPEAADEPLEIGPGRSRGGSEEAEGMLEDVEEEDEGEE
ncbi:hypothetical protein DFJ74DRAFT_477728 [Hyaloraphidium curvatum]|nr:hypothetical protein DFJ74DRAFT_477728 [Hyaloraphidium curvatum]